MTRSHRAPNCRETGPRNAVRGLARVNYEQQRSSRFAWPDAADTATSTQTWMPHPWLLKIRHWCFFVDESARLASVILQPPEGSMRLAVWGPWTGIWAAGSGTTYCMSHAGSEISISSALHLQVGGRSQWSIADCHSWDAHLPASGSRRLIMTEMAVFTVANILGDTYRDCQLQNYH